MYEVPRRRFLGRLSLDWSWDFREWFIDLYRSERIVIFDFGPLRLIWKRRPC